LLFYKYHRAFKQIIDDESKSVFSNGVSANIDPNSVSLSEYFNGLNLILPFLLFNQNFLFFLFLKNHLLLDMIPEQNDLLKVVVILEHLLVVGSTLLCISGLDYS
jgi:hypothetical protein